MKKLGHMVAFLVLVTAMYVDKGCSRLTDGPAAHRWPEAPAQTAEPARAARKAPPKARRAPRKPLTVRRAERAARCWGPACYHDHGYRGGRADDRIAR